MPYSHNTDKYGHVRLLLEGEYCWKPAHYNLTSDASDPCFCYLAQVLTCRLWRICGSSTAMGSSGTACRGTFGVRRRETSKTSADELAGQRPTQRYFVLRIPCLLSVFSQRLVAKHVLRYRLSALLIYGCAIDPLVEFRQFIAMDDTFEPLDSFR